MKFIPINEALKALAAAGHDVAKPGRKQDRVAGFGGPHYLIDGKFYGLAAVRAMVADLGLEKDTKAAAAKPKREIETLADAVAADPRCRKREVWIGTWGERNLHGQVVYGFRMLNKEGERTGGPKTLRAIREWCQRNGVI